MIALDTNVLIALERGDKKVLAFMETMRRDHKDIALPFPVLSEYYYGYLKKGEGDVQEALARLDSFELLHSTKGVAMRFAEIAHRLGKRGYPLPDMDVLIAAICVDHDAVLVTADRHFERIKDLRKIILTA